MNFGLDNYNEMMNHFDQECADELDVTGVIDALSTMKYWAYHTDSDLADLCFDVERSIEDEEPIDFIPYTEDELNKIRIDAEFAINMFHPNDEDYYVRTGNNAYYACKYIIKKCEWLIDVMHGKF